MSKKRDSEEDSKQPSKTPTCGIVMPISGIDGCQPDHWSEVKSIIYESVESISTPSFKAKLVSDADDVGVIQKRIVQSLYDSDIVICDVSGKNPNVMFELGMRLAFDKPTVIIKDDKTDYSFDTAVIEHLTYPRDLRFSKIVDFKQDLAKKVEATYKSGNANQTSFLKNFGTFQVAQLDEKVIPAEKAVLEMLSEMQRDIFYIKRSAREPKGRIRFPPRDRHIRDTIFEWLTLHKPITPIECLGNEKFYNYVETRVAAPSFFENRREFIDFLDRQLLELDEESSA